MPDGEGGGGAFQELGDDVLGLGVEVVVDEPDLRGAFGEGDIAEGACDLVVFDEGADSGSLEELAQKAGEGEFAMIEGGQMLHGFDYTLEEGGMSGPLFPFAHFFW